MKFNKIKNKKIKFFFLGLSLFCFFLWIKNQKKNIQKKPGATLLTVVGSVLIKALRYILGKKYVEVILGKFCKNRDTFMQKLHLYFTG